MKRTNLNFTIDVLTFIGFIFLTTTGILMYYVLPAGSGHYVTIWGLDRHQWGAIHFWIAVVFFSILTIHLILHWRWIVNVVRGKSDKDTSYRTGLGIVGLFALIAISISPLLSPIEVNKNQTRSTTSSENDSSKKINGSFNFLDIEKETGVPAAYIIDKLNLPTDTPLNRRIGLLKKEHGFEMSIVSKIIKRYPVR